MEPEAPANDLPEFDAPPVVEMAVAARFRIMPGLRGLALSPLYEQWRGRYPQVEEQPPLPAVVEEGVPNGPTFQLNLGAAPAVRYWFLTRDGDELVQLQQDLLSVNWRERVPGKPYPRYAAMRQLFSDRIHDLETFAARNELGPVHVTQLELSYINAVDVDGGDGGKLGRILTTWQDVPNSRLAGPEQVQLNMSYQVTGLGPGVSRLWVQAGLGQRSTGAPAIFLTFSIRGAPKGEGITQALAFLDSVHEQVLRSFAELTTPEMHRAWGRRL